MTMPIDLVLVRHGESEGNVANKRSYAGDHSVFTPQFRNRHTSEYRLSKRGQLQAKKAGEFLVREFINRGIAFDRYFTSTYHRARETAGLLSIPGARWEEEPDLVERGWGDLERFPQDERAHLFGDVLARHDQEPFLWRPPGGETFLELRGRAIRLKNMLSVECTCKSVMFVCHGEVMRAFQVLYEHLTQERFRELVLSHDSQDSIYNCQVVHYTRRNPTTGKIAPEIMWVQWFRPTDTPMSCSGWRTIERRWFSNEELLAAAERIPRLVED